MYFERLSYAESYNCDFSVCSNLDFSEVKGRIYILDYLGTSGDFILTSPDYMKRENYYLL